MALLLGGAVVLTGVGAVAAGGAAVAGGRILYQRIKESGKGKVLGQPLASFKEKRLSQSSLIPFIVEDTLAHLLQNGVYHQGLFRVPGSAVRLKELAELYDCDKRPDLSDEDIDVVACLLKFYLRELPESLIPYRVSPDFLDVEKKCDVEATPMRKMSDCVANKHQSAPVSNLDPRKPPPLQPLPPIESDMLSPRNKLFNSAEGVLDETNNDNKNTSQLTQSCPTKGRRPTRPPPPCPNKFAKAPNGENNGESNKNGDDNTYTPPPPLPTPPSIRKKKAPPPLPDRTGRSNSFSLPVISRAQDTTNNNASTSNKSTATTAKVRKTRSHTSSVIPTYTKIVKVDTNYKPKYLMRVPPKMDLPTLDDKVQDWVNQITDCLAKLPLGNIRILNSVLSFLWLLSLHSEKNKMTPQNIAIVFGPIFIYSEDPANATDLLLANCTIVSLVTKMIKYQEYIFNTLDF